MNSRAVPPFIVLTKGVFSSLGLGKLTKSINFSFGSNSARATPSILLPVPGSPINRTCLLCCAAFFIMFTASS